MNALSAVECGDITTFTMSNAAKRNSLNAQLMAEMKTALLEAQNNKARVFIIQAEPGVRVWSAGHDIDELPCGDVDPTTWVNPLEDLLATIRLMPYPVIASVEGSAWGGACDLAITCDLIVATRTATFAITPAKLGVAYSSGGVAHFVSSLPLHVAKEMYFTAEPITAEQARHWGLVNRVVEDCLELRATTMTLAERIATLAPLTIASVKAEMSAQSDPHSNPDATTSLLESRRAAAWSSDDYREGIAAFKERRTPLFRGE